MRILLAEDNRMVQEMMLDALELYDYEIILASNGLEAIEQAHKALPDLILMDMSMPEVDGWSASSQLKQDPSTRHIPIIAVTAHAIVGEKERALEAGCDDYISKPVQLNLLIEKIKKFAQPSSNI